MNNKNHKTKLERVTKIDDISPLKQEMNQENNGCSKSNDEITKLSSN